MRHYYRFMELEPVLEQEEDSVGEASPTSSMGSPSFSPPPDAWAQIASKDFHDPLSSHLLQEHLDLQRAYRLLEVQMRNYDSRASRDLQKMKDALPAQERLREELQRAKEREATLRGEIYDLHEQNELLEFRILELEECQENASTRSGLAGSRDVATETDTCDVTHGCQTSLPVDGGIQLGIQERLGDAPDSADGSATHGLEPRLAPDKEDDNSELSNKLDPEQHDDVQGHAQETTPTSHSSDSSPHPLSEGISCTLCRRLPRRRSFPEPSQPPPEVEASDGGNQRDALRKSKSDGEIIARKTAELNSMDESLKQTELSEEEDSSKKLKDLANVKKLDTAEGPLRVHRCVGTQVSTKDEGVQVQVGLRAPLFSGRVEDQVRTMRGMLASIYKVLQETRVEVECTNSELREEVQTLESTVQRLKEESARAVGNSDLPSGPPPVRRSRSLSFSKDCYCCSQDLQPSLEEVICKLHQVMDLITDAGDTLVVDPEDREEKKYEEFPKCDEMKNEKENREVEDIQVGEIVVRYNSKENRDKEERIEERIEGKNKRNSIQKPSSDHFVGVSETLPLWTSGGQQQTQTKEKLSPPPLKKKPSNGTIPTKQIINENIKSKMHQEDWNPENRNDEYDLIRRSIESQSQETTKSPAAWKPEVMPKNEDLVTNRDVHIPPLNGVTGVDYSDPRDRFREYEGCVVKRTDEAIKHLEELAPLPEEKTKPVLRRWREQLLVRRDRVQPWRIEMLDFPKRMPSVV